MQKLLLVIVGALFVFGPFRPEVAAQEGPAERFGEQLDRGIEQLSEKLQRTWADIKKSVDELSMQGRVYARLRWDKALADQKIDIQVEKNGAVVLAGAVPDEATRQKAVELAKDTVGVRQVVNQLRIEARPGAEASPPDVEPLREK